MTRFLRFISASALGGLLFAAALTGHPARAGQDQWTGLASIPGHTAVLGLAVAADDPQTVVAATASAGIWKSVDGGTSWTRKTVGITTGRLWCLAFDPFGGDLWAGSQGQGVYRSHDRGETWSQAGSHLAVQNVRAVAFGRGYVVLGTSSGVLLSDDGGVTFRNIGPSGLDVSAVAINASSPLSILAGGDAGASTPGAYLYRSTDQGRTWAFLNQGIPADAVVLSLVAGPLPAGAEVRPLLAGTNDGLFSSNDGGANWAEVTAIPPINPREPRPRPFNVAGFSQADAQVAYAASDGLAGQGAGIWRTRDGGATWTGLNDGLPSANFTALGIGRGANPPLVAAIYAPDTDSSSLLAYTDSGAPSVTPSLPPGFASPPPPATPTPVPSTPPAATGSRRSLLAPIGAAAGVLVIAALVGGLLLRRKRSQDS